MRVLLLSDIHGNIDALEAVEAEVLRREPFDEVWVLGDLVDYGGAPAEVVAWVRARASRVVRGNHDHAMGTGEDCRSAPLYHDLSVATREYFRPRLAPEVPSYLAALPLRIEAPVNSHAGALLVHASPADPLFGYVPRGSTAEIWRAALGPARTTSLVLLGHTHEQFERQVDEIRIVNPGSVGLPKDGDPRAAFAVFHDERVELRRLAYDTGRAAARVAALSLDPDSTRRLCALLQTARLPQPA